MRTRRLALVLALAVLAGTLFVPSAGSAELWDGKWRTKNDFGTPKLNLTQTKGHVEGTYTDNGGDIKGTIWGDLSDDGHVWTGRYKQNGADEKGKFRVEILGDQVSFEGWFKSCPSTFSSCSKKYDWTGEHV